MLRQLTQAFLSTTLLLPLGAQPIQERYKYAVIGRVVDGCGQPVAHAQVLLFPPKPLSEGKGGDQLIVEETADDKGRFRYEGEATDPVRQNLYVTTPYPPNAEAPITPPFDEVKGIDRLFDGRPVLIKKNEDVNVGDVIVQVRYGVVLVQLQNRMGKPLFTDAADWEWIGLRVRDARGKVVSEFSLSPASVRRAVRVDQSAIAVALPEGTWSIEIAPDGEGGVWLKSNTKLLVQVSNSPLQITLKPPTKRNERTIKRARQPVRR